MESTCSVQILAVTVYFLNTFNRKDMNLFLCSLPVMSKIARQTRLFILEWQLVLENVNSIQARSEVKESWAES